MYRNKNIMCFSRSSTTCYWLKYGPMAGPNKAQRRALPRQGPGQGTLGVRAVRGEGGGDGPRGAVCLLPPRESPELIRIRSNR